MITSSPTGLLYGTKTPQIHSDKVRERCMMYPRVFIAHTKSSRSLSAEIARCSPLTLLLPNAGRQARRAAGATQERTLAAVACTPLLGGWLPTRVPLPRAPPALMTLRQAQGGRALGGTGPHTSARQRAAHQGLPGAACTRHLRVRPSWHASLLPMAMQMRDLLTRLPSGHGTHATHCTRVMRFVSYAAGGLFFSTDVPRRMPRKSQPLNVLAQW